jgi:hypothetical protein
MEDTMRLQSLAIPAALAVLAAMPAHAEETGRYRLEKSPDGYVRMDTVTGAMSICQEQSGQLVCKMAADERRALQDDIERLQGSVKALNERVTRLENSVTARLESRLPSEEDFNRTMGYMERFFKRFMGMAREMEKQDQDDTGKAPPDRT